MKNKYKLIDLTHPVHSEIPTWDMTCGYFVKTMRDYQHCEGVVKFRSQSLDIRASAGTHIDAPAHCFAGKADVSELPLNDLIVPGIVIDVSDKVHQNYKVLVEDIKLFENKYGVIISGTLVLFYTGWSQHWNEPKKYHNNLSFPSVSADAASLLLERNIVGIGIDTLSPDSGNSDFAVHASILGANKYILENVDQLHLLPPRGIELIVMPLKIKNAAESPIRLVARIQV